MRVALDTNILAYAEGVGGAARKRAALDLVERLPAGSAVLLGQSLGELFNVLVRKARRSAASARSAVLSWQDAFPVSDTTATVMARAADLSAHHRFSIWDAVILSGAAEAGCRLLLSEDLQEGFTWSGVTVANPFLDKRNALLVSLLEGT